MNGDWPALEEQRETRTFTSIGTCVPLWAAQKLIECAGELPSHAGSPEEAALPTDRPVQRRPGWPAKVQDYLVDRRTVERRQRRGLDVEEDDRARRPRGRRRGRRGKGQGEGAVHGVAGGVARDTVGRRPVPLPAAIDNGSTGRRRRSELVDVGQGLVPPATATHTCGTRRPECRPSGGGPYDEDRDPRRQARRRGGNAGDGALAGPLPLPAARRDCRPLSRPPGDDLPAPLRGAGQGRHPDVGGAARRGGARGEPLPPARGRRRRHRRLRPAQRHRGGGHPPRRRHRRHRQPGQPAARSRAHRPDSPRHPGEGRRHPRALPEERHRRARSPPPSPRRPVSRPCSPSISPATSRRRSGGSCR